MMDACICGNPEAMAIRDAWKFQESRATKIKLVSHEDYEQMVERQGSVTFGA